MLAKRLRSIGLRTTIALMLPLLAGGCFFDLRAKNDFQSWYYGDPGMAGALGENQCDRYADRIQGTRHPYYLHFRSPEIFLQPQGGTRYPERTTAEGRAQGAAGNRPDCEQVAKGWETFRFDVVDGGLVDVVLPYRRAAKTNNADRGFGRESLVYTGSVVYNSALAAVMKAPIYFVHDILKTLYIPVAGTYYLLKPASPAEAPAKVGHAMDAGATAGTMVAVMAASNPLPGGLVDGVRVPAGDQTGVVNAALTDKASAPDDMVRLAAGRTVPAPAAYLAVADAGQTDRPVVQDSVGAAAATIATRIRSSRTPNQTVDSTAVPADKASADKQGAADMPVTDPAPAADVPADPVEPQEAASAPAAVAQTPAPTEGTPSIPSAPASREAIVEEDLDEAAPAAETPATSQEPVRTPEAPVEAPVAAPSPAEPARLEKVRIAKRKLRKKAAFIGFYSRNPNVDASTKRYLEEHLWPVFQEECKRNLILLHQGHEDYPAALDALVRDPFGRLNSFELTTVARFSGLNAIIAATIIDVRISKEISGILWYKTPEGQLRFTIQVEVFDAETGTKLFDRTYIREEEVEELEPGADESLRKEDQAVLRAALQSVAEDIGEHVCEALDDQPWRAFVSSIDGNRITLSAGQSAGLAPGNVLSVHNSQIIDGLNNQQFFLTGEKVGRIQIVSVLHDRAEALMIDGKGLRGYSVAMPE